jgi:hypothetical protein
MWTLQQSRVSAGRVWMCRLLFVLCQTWAGFRHQGSTIRINLSSLLGLCYQTNSVSSDFQNLQPSGCPRYFDVNHERGTYTNSICLLGHESLSGIYLPSTLLHSRMSKCWQNGGEMKFFFVPEMVTCFWSFLSYRWIRVAICHKAIQRMGTSGWQSTVAVACPRVSKCDHYYCS